MKKIILMAVASLLILGLWNCYSPKRNIEYWRNLFHSELKVGDDADSVDAFFKRHNFEYEYTGRPQYGDEFERYYYAKIYESSGIELLRKSIAIRILMDENMKVKEIIFEEWYTGP